MTSLSSTISTTHAVRANPDFAPPGVIQEQLSGLPTDGAAALASGADATALPWSRICERRCFRRVAAALQGPGAPPRLARRLAIVPVDAPMEQYVYVYGGGNSSGGYYNDLWRWTPATQTWTQLANMPTAKQNIQGAYWNGKIYVPGGFNGAHITENAIYDIATNTWTTGAPLPAATDWC